MKTRINLLFVLILLVFASFTDPNNEKVLLRMHLDKGDTYKYHIKYYNTVSVMGGLIITKIELEVDVHVDNIDSKGRYILSFTLPHLKFEKTLNSEKPKVVINTDGESDTGLAKWKSIIPKLKIKGTMLPNRRIESVNIDEALALVGAELGTESEKIKNEIKGAAMQKIFSSIAFPDQKLGVGDSWEIKPSESKTFENGLGVRYEIKSILGDQTVIGISADTSAHKGNIESSSMLMTGTLNGDITLDLKTGLFTSWKENSDYIVKTFEHGTQDLTVKVKSSLDIQKIP